MHPVEYQKILAIVMRRKEKSVSDDFTKHNISMKAKALEDSAEADAQCEIRWGARKE
jgi:hypothetical protein